MAAHHRFKLTYTYDGGKAKGSTIVVASNGRHATQVLKDRLKSYEPIEVHSVVLAEGKPLRRSDGVFR